VDKIEEFKNRTSHRFRIIKHISLLYNSEETTNYKNEFPISIEIHLTDKCNLNCIYCYYENTRKCNVLSTEIIDTFINDIINQKHTLSVVFSGGGEPTCHNYFSTAINKLSYAGISVGVLTNGVIINDNILKAFLLCKWIRFSINAVDSKSYSRINSSPIGTFEKVCKNIMNITKHAADRELITGISMIVCDQYDDIDYLEKFICLASELGVNYVMYRPLQGFPELDTKISKNIFYSWIHRIEKVAEDKNIVTNYKVFLKEKFKSNGIERGYNGCPLANSNFITLLTSDGNIFPCVELYQNNILFSFGNLNKSRYNEILNGPIREKIIRNINTCKCPDCRHNHMNEVMIEYMSGKKFDFVCQDPHWRFL
jgi:MoaA/NifB/PqqE/SkfB family radical SAM enzyme